MDNTGNTSDGDEYIPDKYGMEYSDHDSNHDDDDEIIHIKFICRPSSSLYYILFDIQKG